MKKKQFKRIEHLLVDLVGATIGNGSYLSSIDTQMAPVSRAAAKYRPNATTIRYGGDSKTEGAASGGYQKVDVELKPTEATTAESTEVADAIQQEAVARMERMERKLLDGKAEELGRVRGWLLNRYSAIGGGPGSKMDTTLLVKNLIQRLGNGHMERVNSLEGKLTDCQDMHQDTLKRFEAVNQDNTDLNQAVNRLQAQRDELERRCNDKAKELKAIADWVREYTGKDMHDFYLLEAIQLIMKGAKESYDDLAKANQHLERKLSETKAKLENCKSKYEGLAHTLAEEQAKAPLSPEGRLFQDASVGAFRNWVGAEGWAWVMAHTEQLADTKDRLYREEAYDRRQKAQAAKDAEMREFNEQSMALQKKARQAPPAQRSIINEPF